MKSFKNEFNKKVPLLLNKESEYNIISIDKSKLQEKNQKLKEEIIQILKEKQELVEEIKRLRVDSDNKIKSEDGISLLRKELTYLLIQNDKLKSTIMKLKDKIPATDHSQYDNIMSILKDNHLVDENNEQFIDLNDLQEKYFHILGELKKAQRELNEVRGGSGSM